MEETNVTDRLDDFPDRLSPMLVKELRQGLRARSFVIVFLILQALLGLILLIATAGTSSGSGGQTVSEFVFVCYSLAVLVIQPLRGIGTLASEIRSETIDLMVLTRLSSWRIVAGKWVAIVSQSGLITCTIVPYLILRYYFGQMNLFAELLMMALIFLVSCGLTAITVGLSACQAVLVRGVLPILAAPVLAWWIFKFGFGGELGHTLETLSLDSASARWGLLFFIVAVVYFAWSMLSLGASLIAPHAENHSTLRRLIALGTVAAAGAVAVFMHPPKDIVPFLWFLFAAPAVALSLAEPELLVPTVCRAFVRRGTLGVIAGRVLYPGWPSGVVFTLLIAVIGFVELLFQGGGLVNDHTILFLGLLGSLLLPGVIVTLAGAKMKDRAATFVLLWIAFAVLVAVITLMADSIKNYSLLWAFIWDPAALVPMDIMSSSSSKAGFVKEDLLHIGIAVDVVYFVAMLAGSMMAFRRIRNLERKALEDESS